jgi:hypothetical protein
MSSDGNRLVVPELKSTLLKTSRLLYGVCFGLAKTGNNQRELGTMEGKKTFLKSRDVGIMKVKLMAYKYHGTLKREFSSFEQAPEVAKLMAKKSPDIIFKPFIEQGDSLKLDSYDSWEEKSIRPHKKPGDSFVDRISEFFENED